MSWLEHGAPVAPRDDPPAEDGGDPTPSNSAVIPPNLSLLQDGGGGGQDLNQRLLLPPSIGRAVVASDNDVSNGFVKDGKMLPYVFEANEAGVRKRSSKILPVCGVCGKRFVCVTTMKRHLVTHTGEKPFSCKVCGKQYTQKGNLRVHERTHRNDRPFECNICHQKFYRKEPMQKHQWRQHGIVHSKLRPLPPITPHEATSTPPSTLARPVSPAPSSYSEFPDPPMAHQPERNPSEAITAQSSVRFQYSKLSQKYDPNVYDSPAPPRAHSQEGSKHVELSDNDPINLSSSQSQRQSVQEIADSEGPSEERPMKLKYKLAQAYQREVQELRDREEREEGGRELSGSPMINAMDSMNIGSSESKEMVDCQCKSCGNTFSVQDPYNFRCNNCHVKYSSVPTHVIADPLQCIGCCQVFPHKPALKAHQTRSEKERPFRCCRCGYGFRQKAHLQKHQWRIHRRKIETDQTVKDAEAFFQTIKESDSNEETTKVTIQDIINHRVEHSLQDKELESKHPGKTSSKYFSDVLGLEFEGPSAEKIKRIEENSKPLDLSPLKRNPPRRSDSPSAEDGRQLRNLISSMPFGAPAPTDTEGQEEMPENLTVSRPTHSVSPDRLQQLENNPLLNQPPLSLDPNSPPPESTSQLWKKVKSTHKSLPPIASLARPAPKIESVTRSLLTSSTGSREPESSLRYRLLGLQSGNARTV